MTEHYTLLRRLCKGKNLVVDVGTYLGHSAIAMSTAKKVITFDVTDRKLEFPDNVTQIIHPDFTKFKEVYQAEIILIDVDPHDAIKEPYFLNELVKNGYKGTLLFDDIHLPKMEPFWNGITFPKKDLTHIGHYTGTGIVFLA